MAYMMGMSMGHIPFGNQTWLGNPRTACRVIAVKIVELIEELYGIVHCHLLLPDGSTCK